jgi:hypothetical protein
MSCAKTMRASTERAANPLGIPLIPAGITHLDSSLPPDVNYRGCRIVWDARQLGDNGLWTGRVAVVLANDVSGVQRVHRIRWNDQFTSEDDAQHHMIAAAKDWIDNIPSHNSQE